jgi:hypothetical protein
MPTNTRFRRVVRAGCAVLALAGAGTAQAASDDYDWLGIVYLWGADIGVDSRDASIDVDFSDVVDKLEMAFQTHVEVQGDDIGGFVDLSFVGVGDSSHRANAHLDADLDMTALDMALVWSPGAERMTGLELYGGLRYIDTDFRLVIDPDPAGPQETRTGINTTYTDLLAGARYIAPINDRWRLSVNADLSGLDTEGTWSLGMYGVYRTGPHRFIVGYRNFEMDLKGGHGQKVTETFSGPTIAYGYAF